MCLKKNHESRQGTNGNFGTRVEHLLPQQVARVRREVDDEVSRRFKGEMVGVRSTFICKFFALLKVMGL